MNLLSPTTQRRLKNIPQNNSVWEGERRRLNPLRATLEPDPEAETECIIWVDGSEGCIRSMEMVSARMGPEAMVRALLRAIELPQNPARPSRPKKIIVRDREMQFFLRGVLQNLDITVDYVPELPLIDDIFKHFEEAHSTRPPIIPENWTRPLLDSSQEIWDAEPWTLLADHDILKIEIDRPDSVPLYLCTMGMSGREYGVLLYRSLDSLKQFRRAILTKDPSQSMEKVFLTQDCWFLTYESDGDEDEEEDFDISDALPTHIQPLFGSIHPYEGIRPYIDEEEAETIFMALTAFLRFFKGHEYELSQEPIASSRQTFRVPLKTGGKKKETVSVKVSTVPELGIEFLEDMDRLGWPEDEDDDDGEDEFEEVFLDHDFIPDNAYIDLRILPRQIWEELRSSAGIVRQEKKVKPAGEGLPVVLIQSSRQKALEMIDRLKEAGGIDGIGFNPGENPYLETSHELVILKMANGELVFVDDFDTDDPTYLIARSRWHECRKAVKGYCGLIIAFGMTGSSKGSPQPKNMLALFETRAIEASEIGIGTLILTPNLS